MHNHIYWAVKRIYWSHVLGAGSFMFGDICGIWGLSPHVPLVLAPAWCSIACKQCIVQKCGVSAVAMATVAMPTTTRLSTVVVQYGCTSGDVPLSGGKPRSGLARHAVHAAGRCHGQHGRHCAVRGSRRHLHRTDERSQPVHRTSHHRQVSTTRHAVCEGNHVSLLTSRRWGEWLTVPPW